MTRTTSRQLMIDAAEQIVAERGLPALTLKDVQIAANQSNKSAAKYHFGSREGLLDAVVDARMSRVNARRHEMLTALLDSTEVPTSRQLVEALVRPLAAETLGAWVSNGSKRAESTAECVRALRSGRRHWRPGIRFAKPR